MAIPRFTFHRPFLTCLSTSLLLACSSDPPQDGSAGGTGGGTPGSGGSAASGGASSGGTSSGGAPGAGGQGGAGTGGASTGGLSTGGTGTGSAGGGVGAAGGTPTTGGAGGSASGGASSGGTGGGGVIPDLGGIEDLTIEANPNSVLSVYVSWTTTEPGTSVVQFGAGDLEWEVAGAPDVTEHRVLVIGLRAETEYQFRGVSKTTSAVVTGDGNFTTASLPEQIPVGTVNVSDARREPGWTLMNVQKGDGTNRALSGAPPAAVIYDEEGYPVWYFINGTTTERGGAISVDSTDLGVIMGPTLSGGGGQPFGPIEVDWAGNEIWSCSDPLCGAPDQLSHHAGKLSNGNYIVMRDASSGGLISQIFMEMNPESQLVHSIGVEDGLMPPQGASGDWAHGNSITVDLESDVAYMSFRWLGCMKMTYSTGALQWHLPAKYGQDQLGDFGDMAFVPPESQFTDIHDPEIHDDGTILFFDNGGYSGVIEDGNPGGRQTRAVEYMIDETEKTATLVWEWPGDFDTDPWYKSELYVPFWGDADRLGNGNVLITAGRRGTTAATPESRIIEVDKASGEVVWELSLPKDHGVYRAERLSPPLLRRLTE